MGSVGERPKTGEMLAALDAAFGGREEVLKRMDVAARAAGIAVFPVPYFWAAHCAREVESPSTAPQDAVASVSPPPTGSAPADAVAVQEVQEREPRLYAGSEEGAQDGLFGAGDLQEVAPKPGVHQSIYVHFENYEDIKAFGELIGLPVTTQTRQITYPPPNLRAVQDALK